MRVLIKSSTSRTAVGQLTDLTAIPLGVEYERLSRDLEKHTFEKYKDRTDLRQQTTSLLDNIEKKEEGLESQDKKTLILSPGMLIDYENSQHDSPAYPMSDVPSTKGLPWSDNF